MMNLKKKKNFFFFSYYNKKIDLNFSIQIDFCLDDSKLKLI
jgi:hypothetical protein